MLRRGWLVVGCGGALILGVAACDADGGDDEGASRGGADSEGDDPTDASDDEPEPEPEPGPEPEPEPETCSEQAASRACEVEPGTDGMQFCDGGVWGPCATDVECELGDVFECGFCDPDSTETENCPQATDSCVLHEGLPMWGCSIDEDCACNTPLVLSFDGAEPELRAAPAASFDLDVAGGCVSTDWPMASTPWLALDRDGDGAIADGRELFGSGTRLASGRRAQHGFVALAELDANGDGRIDARDPDFSKLLVWADEDGDKRGTAGELQSLQGTHVLSIDLAYQRSAVCDARGNCGIERATFNYVARGGAIASGLVVDLHLACQ